MSRLAAMALERPYLTIAAVLLLSGFFATQALRLTAETGYRAYIGADHPTVAALDHFIDGFGGGLPMAAVWSCAESPACEHVFDAKAVEMASSIVYSLQGLGGVRAVHSPATTSLLIGTAESIESTSALEPEHRARMLKNAPENDLWTGRLISSDAQTGAIVIELASSDSAVTKSILEQLEALLGEYAAQGFEFHIVGQTAQFALTDESLAQDSQRLLPVTMTLVALTIFVLFRSWQTVLAALVTVGLASLWTTGFMGWMAWPKNAISETIPPLVLVIALSDAIHLLSRYSQRRASTGALTRRDRTATMLRAVAETGVPCFVTSATTGIGLLSFTASGLDSFIRFGLVSGFGVMVALGLTFTVLPILIVLLPSDPIRDTKVADQWGTLLRALTRMTRRNARSIAIVAVLIAVTCGIGMARLEVDVDEYKLYGEGSSVVRAFRFLERNLRLPDALELELKLPVEQDLRQPETLEQLERFAAELSGIDGLARTQSVLDAIRWTNRLLHDGDAAYAALPANSSDATAILSLITLTDPRDLEPWVGPDFRRLRFSVEARKMPQSQRAAVIAGVEQAVARNLGAGWETTLTGSFVVYHDLVEEIHLTQLRSFGIAAVLVFILLTVFLRSWGGTLTQATKWAVIGMFPTLLPVAATLGVMGYAGIALDMGTAMVAAIIIGIAVDDTVHLLGEFYRRRRTGTGPGAAIDGSVLHIGQAVVTTSIALSAGFFVLVLSSWQSISSFGFLSGIAILGALAGDLVVLPALIHLVSGEASEPEEEDWAREERPSQRTRVIVSLLALLPILAVLSLSGDAASSAETRGVIACRTVPNGVVPLIAGSNRNCPLQPLDRIVSVSTPEGISAGAERAAFLGLIRTASGSVGVLVERAEEVLQVEVPVLRQTRASRLYQWTGAAALVALILAFAIRIYWQSETAAATALLFLASAVSTEIVSVLCASYSDTIYWISVPAGPLIGASLAHLALTFPRESQSIRRVRGILVAPYVLAGLLAAVELRALGVAPALWLLSQRFVLILAGCASAVLLWRSLAGLSADRTPLERVRGRVLMVGCFGVLAAAIGTISGWGAGLPGGHLTPLLGGVIAFIVPLGLAIHRYDLFDFSSRALSGVGRVSEVTVLGVTGAVAVWSLNSLLGTTGPLVWAAGAICASLCLSGARRLHMPWLEMSARPLSKARSRVLEAQQRDSLVSSTEDTSARLAGQAIEAGLNTNGVALFLGDGSGGWRPAHVGQELGAFRVAYARAAIRSLADHDHLHLVRGDTELTSDVRMLLEAGVELVVAIKVGAEVLGLLLIGHPRGREAFSHEELDFATAVASNAALAFHHMHTLQARAAVDRQRALAQLVSGIVHDIARPLRVLERRAHRIADRSRDRDHVEREVGKIEEIVAQILAGLREMAEGFRVDDVHPESAALTDVVAEVVREFDVDDTDSARVLMSLSPDLPRVDDPTSIKRVLSNLVSNAVEASNASDAVWVYATSDAIRVRIDVVDQGVGMDAATASRAFELFFTTRRDEGGSGIGLAIAREIIEDLGGKIEIESRTGEGTRATVLLPAALRATHLAPLD